MAVNLTLVSPSSVGAYAVCSQKLVYDSTHGKPFGSSEHADFGTLCHYQTQYKLGLNPRKEPDESVALSARRLPEFVGQTEEVFFAAVNKCADRAIAAIPKLPPGVDWLAEYEIADTSLLPTRLSRTTGKVKGFGGDIDLLRTDRVELIDLKFVGKLPSKVKVEYLWQMGSYHIVTGVPRTTLLFVTRDGKFAARTTIDWSIKSMAELAQQMRRVIDKMGHVDFERYAVPVLGDQCGFCDHKSRCPLQALPDIKHHVEGPPPQPADMTFIKNLFAGKSGSLI